MRPANPSSVATWLLEHCSPSNGDGALRGDLEEELRSGRRSAAWYWRQVIAACMTGWLEHLRGHQGLFVFAATWSMLAAPWIAVIDRIENAFNFEGRIWRMDWPFSALSIFAVWIVLNLLFIWTGILLYLALHNGWKKSFSLLKFSRAILLSLAIFLPAYVGLFVLLNLLSYPGPAIDRHTMTPLGELTDLRLWAIELRLPYFLTIVCALWKWPQRFGRGVQPLVLATPQRGPQPDTESETLLTVGGESTTPPSVRPAIIAGLFGALDAAFLLCRAPHPPVPFATNRELMMHALSYILAAALAGAGGSAFFWRRSRGSRFGAMGVVALSSAAGSVWIPAVVLLFRQESAWIVPVAVIAAAVLAVCWRPFASADLSDSGSEIDRSELLAETLQPFPRSYRGLWLAIGIYGAGLELFYDRDFAIASALLAVCAYAVAWQLTLAKDDTEFAVALKKKAASRLLRTALPAFVVTFLALLAWNPKNNGAMAAGGSSAESGSNSAADSSHQRSKDKSADIAGGLLGFQSIVLWPLAEKSKLVLPPTPGMSPNLDVINKPVVIRFDGSYWYFQSPRQAPGPEAKVARGTPLHANVHSTNFMPLIMEAHQKLSTRGSLTCCRAIQIELESCDSMPGDIALNVALADSAVGTCALDLGFQPVPPSTSSLFATGCLPRNQTLTYLIPHHASIHKFNEIRVRFSPDPARAEAGAQIAVKQFELLPR